MLVGTGTVVVGTALNCSVGVEVMVVVVVVGEGVGVDVGGGGCRERKATIAYRQGGISFALPVGSLSTILGRYLWTGSSTVKRVLCLRLRAVLGSNPTKYI
jgi:hypothetical protein